MPEKAVFVHVHMERQRKLIRKDRLTKTELEMEKGERDRGHRGKVKVRGYVILGRERDQVRWKRSCLDSDGFPVLVLEKSSCTF